VKVHSRWKVGFGAFGVLYWLGMLLDGVVTWVPMWIVLAAGIYALHDGLTPDDEPSED
jgi:hypothetical protein